MAETRVELKGALYTKSQDPVPMIPSYFSTANKDAFYSYEHEMRIEAFVDLPPDEIQPDQTFNSWDIGAFPGLTIIIADQTPKMDEEKIRTLGSALGVKISRSSQAMLT